MGNLQETFKSQNSFGGNDKELQDLIRSKGTDVFVELDDPEYFKANLNTILGQLYSWSLSEIKVIYDKYRRYTYFPLMDRTMFCKIMPFSKRNSIYLFEILTKQGHPQYLPFFELLCILILTAYGNSRNKLKMLFNIFDCYGNGSIAFPQWSVFVISFLQAYCRLIDRPFPKRSKLERVAKIIFLKIDVAPYNNALDFPEVLDWLEGTPNMVLVLNRFEPSYIIKEKATVFFSNKRYSDKQVEDITEALLNYGTTGEDSSSKIQEMIRKSVSGDVYNKTRLYENSSRRGSVNSDASQDSDSLKVTTSASPFSKFDFITETKNSKSSPFRTAKAFVIKKNNNTTMGPWSPQGKLSSPSQKKMLNSSTTVHLLPRTQQHQRFLSTEGELNKDAFFQKRKDLMARSRAVIKKNVIITSGRSFTKSDILNLRYYFDEITKGENEMTLKNFVESFAKNANLQKVSASLFNFLDDKGKGYITFTELVRKLYPGMKAEQLRLALEWSQEETNLEKTQGQKKYLEEANKLRKGLHGGFDEAEKRSPVPKEGVKKLKQMFDMYDKEHKGYVSVDNLKMHLGAIFSGQEIEETFKELDKDQDGKLNLKEFIDMILPNDFYIESKLLNDVR